MSARRLLLLLALVTAMVALPMPANAGPRTDAAFVRATNADRGDNGLESLSRSATLAKLARSHSVAMARKSAARYAGGCDSRALWHNDISKAGDHWVWLGPERRLRVAGLGRPRRLGAPDPERLHGLQRPPAQHPVPQGQPVRDRDLDQGRDHLGHGQLRADHARLGLAPANL
jgi:hypothetical protein